LPEAANRYNFSKDVSRVAPKPGHHLGTASFVLGGENHLLWIIEGPGNDCLSFKGQAVEFPQARTYRFQIRGSLVESLSQIAYRPDDRRLKVVLEASGSALDIREATFIYSSQRSPSGVDPDAAFIRLTTASGESIDVALTDLRRGWLPVVIVVGIGLALACGGCSATPVAAPAPVAPGPPPVNPPAVQPPPEEHGVEIIDIYEYFEIDINLLVIRIRFWWERRITGTIPADGSDDGR
jgi:hypothetical protein